ncbi:MULTISPECIES: DUF2971 domain-containing protein [unclassified Pseudoalteromonas]|uniref:DUF2971 domain-containing protein n=1 Tax=unclassified Pseudoalteromonas TaxID=194690 RepID=UPI001F2A786A|nr:MULTISPECIES: DUF2971 domain-containing protein [unclassified Pseudoalteromonas]MCF2829754.1 DUF2971 domain-containing protein [Pseudoalteromonas sp. OF5H-5]MCF2833688.1 DUF2971 domain-containing protein [Pseudoalteromonas sp. DL2-H6]MCF2927692.1 DUF2971 domain-containing protein [Pseudoalteromonas sp. DL2-H1]
MYDGIDQLIEENPILWRYMSLDKFIHLVSSQTLFFSGIGNFIASDPSEGLLPLPVQKILLDELQNAVLLTSPAQLTEQAKSIIRKYSRINLKCIMRSWAISCWHMNTGESEAMWRLYSDTNKGVAIQTDFRSLMKSLQVGNRDILDDIFFEKVSYIDLSAHEFPEIRADVNSIKPVFKSQSFKHENEFRLFKKNNAYTSGIKSEEEGGVEKLLEKLDRELEPFSKENFTTHCSTDELIKKVVISPYTGEPFDYAVNAVCQQFGVKAALSKSTLFNEYLSD